MVDTKDKADRHVPEKVPAPRESIRRTGATLFDAYIFLDWSSRQDRAQGGATVWLSEGRFGADNALAFADPGPINFDTRFQAVAEVTKRLRQHVAEGRRVLIGFDFPYGYPSGSHRMLFEPEGEDPLWKQTWRFLDTRVEDKASNENTRMQFADAVNQRLAFEGGGPYWGRHNTWKPAVLANVPKGIPPCLQDGRVPSLRLVDEQVNAESVWHIFGGPKVVGGQALVGMIHLHRLLEDPVLGPHSEVWPFTSGFTAPRRERGPLVVHAEIWPRLLDYARHRYHPIDDAAQVMSYVRWAAHRDATERLGDWFAPISTANAGPKSEEAARVEGWILGYRM